MGTDATDRDATTGGSDGVTESGPGKRGVTEPDDCEQLSDVDASGALTDVLSLFGKKHTLAIAYEFAFSAEPLRFSDLEERLDISSTTLSNRLSELTERGFVERERFDEIPPRVEYEATEKTDALVPVFEDLYEWAATHEASGEPSTSATDE